MSDIPFEPVVSDTHSFYIVDPEADRVATIDLYERHGVRWMTNVWVEAKYRRKGFITRVMHAVIEKYGHEDIYLSVHGYTNRPLSDDELTAWYSSYGFEPAGAPGIMRRPASVKE